MYRTFAFIFVSIAIAACRKTGVSSAADHKDKIDACSLLTKQEIQEIDGAPAKDTKSSENSNAGLRVAQCFYTVDPFSKSVSLAITQADSSSAKPRSAKQVWEETFGRFEGEAKEEKGDEEKKESLHKGEEEEEANPPKKIEGIGDAAYWTANRVGGALYVLKGDVSIRISVGGPDKEEAKIEKSKSLARKALDRL